MHKSQFPTFSSPFPPHFHFHIFLPLPTNQTGPIFHYLLVHFCDEKVDELNKTISVAAQDPAYYGLNELELEKRRRWTATVHNQVLSLQM